MTFLLNHSVQLYKIRGGLCCQAHVYLNICYSQYCELNLYTEENCKGNSNFLFVTTTPTCYHSNAVFIDGNTQTFGSSYSICYYSSGDEVVFTTYSDTNCQSRMGSEYIFLPNLCVSFTLNINNYNPYFCSMGMSCTATKFNNETTIKIKK